MKHVLLRIVLPIALGLLIGLGAGRLPKPWPLVIIVVIGAVSGVLAVSAMRNLRAARRQYDEFVRIYGDPQPPDQGAGA